MDRIASKVVSRWFVCASIAFAGVASVPAVADELTVEQQVQLARSLTEAQRQATLAANIVLTDSESAKFWPIYREYRAEVAKINDDAIALVKEFAENFDALSNARVKGLADRWLDVEKQRIDLKAKYLDKYAKVLSGTTTARVFQIENKLDALVQVALAKTVPLAPAP